MTVDQTLEQEASKRFRVLTLGCRTNQYESQAYKDQLAAVGYREALPGEPAHLCILNSCTVTESADRRSRQEIRHLVKNNPGARVVVTGCMAESARGFVEAMPGVDLVVPNTEKESLVEQLLPEDEVPEFSIRRFEAHTRAFVKVQDGCNSFCSYCIIPYVRGRSRSRRIPDILEEIRGLVANGYKEVVLTGINIGDFDGAPQEDESPHTLAELIRATDEIPGLERIRVSSIDPDEVDDALMEAIIHGKKTCRSMHLVLQAGSNVVLKRMNRKYTRQQFMDAVDRLRGGCLDFTFTTDIIVGFPGETESDFEETLAVMREVRFAKVHMFPYSERPRTRAARFRDHLPHGVIQERKRQLLRLSEELSYDLRQDFVGRRMEVLTEGVDQLQPGTVIGHTDNFLQVKIAGAGLGSNQILEVELLSNAPDSLVGAIVNKG